MEKACGLDVHKNSIFACILDEEGKKILEKRYGTLTPDLIALRDALVEEGCGNVAMESTSIYWIPIWQVLQSDFLLKLSNPYFIMIIRKVINALIEGKTSSYELVELIHRRTINSHGQSTIREALEGDVKQSDRDLLRQYTRMNQKVGYFFSAFFL